MGTFLVMKNNLKRIFANKYTYLLFILVPALLVGAGIIGARMTEKTVRAGLLHPVKEVQEQLESYNYVQYQIADAESAQTDFIMGKYHYLIDAENTASAKKLLLEISEEGSQTGKGNPLSASKRFAAVLLTAYLVIAAIYASKFIQDREQGTLNRVRTTGTRTGQYLMGYAFSTEVIVAVQTAISILFFMIFNRQSEISQGKAIVLTVIISVTASLYGILHAFFCRREMTANIMASSIAVILSILGGTFVAAEQMPLILQKLSILSPMRWIMTLL